MIIAQQICDNFLRCLDSIEYGALELVTPDGKSREFQGQKPGVKASMHLHDWRVMPGLAAKGDVGLAEGYRQGYWDTANLQNLFSLALSNERILKRYIFGSAIYQTFSRLSYLLKMNSIKGSKKNIHAHYDLGNDFYKLWLDPSMTYSSAMFNNEKESLQQGQYNKYDNILNRLEKTNGQLLEIGCGWGGFANRALERGDFQYKGITLSEQQKQFASKELGFEKEVCLEDYRNQSGKYDSIVSIEMFEAVGEKYWPVYFNKIKSLLAPNGKAVIQTITIDDKRFERYRKGGDVIRSYIFPGGMLPSPSRFRDEVKQAGLDIGYEYHFGQDYAKTLEIWLNTFDANTKNVSKLGYDNSFIRLWRYYLAACIAGFRTGRTSVMQVEINHA